MRHNITAAVVAVALCLLVVGLALAAERSVTTSVSYTPLRAGGSLGTHPSKEACFAAREAQRLADAPSKTSGQSRYVCREDNAETVTYGPSLVTPPPVRQAVLTWRHDGAQAVGYRIHYGTSAAALTQTIQIPEIAARTYTVTGLQPGTYYFAVRAYGDGVESVLSNTLSKTIL